MYGEAILVKACTYQMELSAMHWAYRCVWLLAGPVWQWWFWIWVWLCRWWFAAWGSLLADVQLSAGSMPLDVIGFCCWVVSVAVCCRVLGAVSCFVKFKTLNQLSLSVQTNVIDVQIYSINIGVIENDANFNIINR